MGFNTIIINGSLSFMYKFSFISNRPLSLYNVYIIKKTSLYIAMNFNTTIINGSLYLMLYLMVPCHYIMSV